jgi:hypothetical protein
MSDRATVAKLIQALERAAEESVALPRTRTEDVSQLELFL